MPPLRVLATPVTVYRLPRLDRRSRDVLVAPHTTVAVRQSPIWDFSRRGYRTNNNNNKNFPTTTIVLSIFRVLVAFTHSLYVHVLVIFTYGLTNDETVEYRYFYILVINIACSYLRKFIVQNNKYYRYCTSVLKSVIIFLLLL